MPADTGSELWDLVCTGVVVFALCSVVVDIVALLYIFVHNKKGNYKKGVIASRILWLFLIFYCFWFFVGFLLFSLVFVVL